MYKFCFIITKSLTFSSAATNSFSSFLGNVTGVHLEKHRARNDTVSALTDGVLCSSEAMHVSLITSRVVYTAEVTASLLTSIVMCGTHRSPEHIIN